jgi:acetyl esterase
MTLDRLNSYSPAEARQAYEAMQAVTTGLKPAQVERRWIPSPAGNPLAIQIVRPRHPNKLRPGILYFHGGGWVLGSFRTHERLVRELAVATDTAVVVVEYSRSPEAMFPVAVEQAYSAASYIAEYGVEFGIDGTQLAVMGDGVGANLAAVIAMLAKYRRGPRLSAQILVSPFLEATGQAKQDAGQPFWEAYAPDAEQRRHPMVSPLLTPVGTLRDLPAAWIVTGGRGAARDQGSAYGQKLLEAGVEVTAASYPDAEHDFLVRNSVSAASASREGLTFVSNAIGRVFAGASRVSPAGYERVSRKSAFAACVASC